MSATGSVAIRLSLQDSETVRAALERLCRDGQAALEKLNAAASKPGAGLSAVDRGVADLKGRIEDVAKSSGVVGSFLAGLGPVGLAAAAGIGAAVTVLYEMNRAASELAMRATAIVNLSEAISVSTDQLQALNGEGAKFSLTSDQIAQGLQHLATNLEPAHRAQGALYEDLRRINPELARQIANTKDVAVAYDILGAAIRQALVAGDAATANALARAAFGRNPGQQVNLAADISARGGVTAITSDYVAAGKALEDGLLKHLRELQTQISDTSQRAKDEFASIFAPDILEGELRSAQLWERIARAAKEIADTAKGGGSLFDRLFTAGARSVSNTGFLGRFVPGGLTYSDQAPGERELLSVGRRRIAEMQSGGKPGNEESNIYTQLDTLQRRLAVLGAAATPFERLTAEQLKLNIALKEGNITLDDRNRKLAALNNAELVAKEAARERVGLASEEQIFDARMVQINKEIADGYIKGEAEKRKAIELTRLAAQDAYDAEKVRTSRTPGLTQLGQFQFDDKAIDQVATRSLDNLDTTMVSILNHTERAGDAWRKFGLSAVEAIEQATLKALILAPLARGLSGMLGGGLGGGGIDVKPSDFAYGGIMTSRGPLPLRSYAGGGIASSPQLALFGEGRQNEAFVPLPDGRAIPAVLYGGNRGGNSMTVHGPLVQVDVHGANGDKAIEDAVHRGTQRALAGAAAIMKSYDRSLPARLADIQQRIG